MVDSNTPSKSMIVRYTWRILILVEAEAKEYVHEYSHPVLELEKPRRVGVPVETSNITSFYPKKLGSTLPRTNRKSMKCNKDTLAIRRHNKPAKTTPINKSLGYNGSHDQIKKSYGYAYSHLLAASTPSTSRAALSVRLTWSNVCD